MFNFNALITQVNMTTITFRKCQDVPKYEKNGFFLIMEFLKYFRFS